MEAMTAMSLNTIGIFKGEHRHAIPQPAFQGGESFRCPQGDSPPIMVPAVRIGQSAIQLFTFFLILLYIVFILLDYESIAEGWAHLVPQKYRPFAVNLFNDVKDGMNRYFRGQAFVALCVGILFSIGFLIIDFPLAIGLGLFIGALNMVPYLQVIGFVPTIILAILKAADTGGNFWIIIASATAVFAVVQAIQDGLIVPRVMGRITGLNPAIILLSLSIWGSLMGMLGMIIALPLTTLMLSYYQRFIINRENIHKTESSDNQQKDSCE